MKNRPQIFINTELAEEDFMATVFEETSGYSITPETFTERRFFTEDKESRYNLQWYVDTYEYRNNKVLRYGINSNKLDIYTINNEAIDSELEKAVNQFEGSPIILDDDSKSAQSVNSSSNLSFKSRTSIHKKDKKIEHKNIEKQVFIKAINSLLENENSFTALVDVFERDNKGEISVEENTSLIQTHTTLLYKNPTKNSGLEILVIDPSNLSFSSHLSKLGDLLLSENVNIITKHTNKNIYKPESKTGPEYNHYRDCIDISVKLAFGFNNEGHKKYSIDKILKSEAIKNISNVVGLDKSISFYLELNKTLPIRIKQSSSTIIGKQFCKLTERLSELSTKFDKYNDEEQVESLLTNFKIIAEKEQENTKTIIDIVDIVKDYTTTEIEYFITSVLGAGEELHEN